MKIADNGCGFDGNFDQLGKLFVRPSRNSGSCVGLYLARQLLKRMNSAIAFRRGEKEGFVAELAFPGVPAFQRAPQAVRSEL